MRILIIPDIHNRTEEAERILKAHAHDKAVLLGDYFDSYGDTPADAAQTARWLRESLDDPRRIHLFGNHDLPYAFPDAPHLWCPGWSPQKHEVVSEILNVTHWSQLKLSHLIGNTLCSHAGVSRPSFEHPVLGMDLSVTKQRCTDALEMARAGLEHPALEWSTSLDDKRGGITWLRWHEMEVFPEFSQIVGHTPGDLRFERSGNTFNLCLDTNLQWFGLAEDGALSAIEAATGNCRTIGTV